MAHAQSVLEEALKLPVKERASVAAELLSSLDEAEADDPAEVELLWAEEVERRARRVLAGESQGTPWPEVRRDLLARLTSR
ncbi:MAG TPA: addiction module protein [Thermoanaerobaculia bacterium]|nr:addiction module protein [Thermoanaerobaculia bacterium]